jgi:hypothetical protein
VTIKALVEHYRCPEEFCRCFSIDRDLSQQAHVFRLGHNTLYGQLSARVVSKQQEQSSRVVSVDPEVRNSQCLLCFDPDEAIENLRLERYPITPRRGGTRFSRYGKEAYYCLRPLMPFRMRTYLKRISLRRWNEIVFPSWPVDRTVDMTFERLLLLAMDTFGVNEFPFIWFWPKGYSGCVVMTHDVETTAGLEFCSSLMDIDDYYGVKSSFQIIPEARYAIPDAFLQNMRDREFEINVHDWNHDGRLFSDRKLFSSRVGKINRRAAEWGAQGFRSGALYRNLDWYDSFSFSYDMSVPNVGHLDPHAGGCCTVKPYFIGNLLEIPVTTTQDYMLFYILGDYSIDLWKRQVDSILECSGIASFIVHPDYILKKRERQVYTDLLDFLSAVRLQRRLWIVPPHYINSWWRERNAMTLVRDGSSWRIEGEGSERACVAYARRLGAKLTYLT